VTPRDARQRLVPVLLVLAMAVPAWSGEPAPSPAREGPDRAALPPFHLAGTVVAPPAKMALIVQGDEAGGQWIEEGETIHGYRVVSIEERQVTFERDGQTVVVILGRPGGAFQPAAPDKQDESPPPVLFIPAGRSLLEPDLPAKGRGGAPPSPLPAQGEHAREEEGEAPALDIFGHDSHFREQLEAMRTLLRERLLAPPASPPAE